MYCKRKESGKDTGVVGHSNLQKTSFYTQVSEEQLKKIRGQLDSL